MSEFKQHKVVPDVIDTWPSEVCQVNFTTTHKADLGREIEQKLAQVQPKMYWKTTKPSERFMVMMVDPDAPSRAEPTFRNFLHWLVVNVPGLDPEDPNEKRSNVVNVHAGRTICDYMGPAPPKGSGLHRYVFLVFKQHEDLDLVNLERIKDAEGRKNFIPDDWIKQHFTSPPDLVAANFFQCEHK